jgi:F-type H+-transporting ATPase subunit delta
MSTAAAARYAKALVDIVQDPRTGLAPETALEQLTAFEELLQESRELRVSLISPAVNPARKRAVVGRLGGQLGLHKLVVHLIFVLIDHHRTPLFSEVRRSFQAQMDEANGIARAEVTAALELNVEQRAAIEGRLGKLTGRSMRCSYAVEPGLIGGAAVKIGSKIYDGSVRGHLEALRRKLVGVA